MLSPMRQQGRFGTHSQSQPNANGARRNRWNHIGQELLYGSPEAGDLWSA